MVCLKLDNRKKQTRDRRNKQSSRKTACNYKRTQDLKQPVIKTVMTSKRLSEMNTNVIHIKKEELIKLATTFTIVIMGIVMEGVVMILIKAITDAITANIFTEINS